MDPKDNVIQFSESICTPLPVLVSVSSTAAGAEVATAEEAHDSCLAPCLFAGTSSKGNFAT